MWFDPHTRQSLPLSLHQHRWKSKKYYGLGTKDNFIILELQWAKKKASLSAFNYSELFEGFTLKKKHQTKKYSSQTLQLACPHHSSSQTPDTESCGPCADDQKLLQPEAVVPVPVTDPGEPHSCSQVQRAPTVSAQGFNTALKKQDVGKTLCHSGINKTMSKERSYKCHFGDSQLCSFSFLRNNTQNQFAFLWSSCRAKCNVTLSALTQLCPCTSAQENLSQLFFTGKQTKHIELWGRASSSTHFEILSCHASLLSTARCQSSCCILPFGKNHINDSWDRAQFHIVQKIQKL